MKIAFCKNKKNLFFIFILFNLAGCLSPYSFGDLSEVPEGSWKWNVESSQKTLDYLERDHQTSQQYNQELRKKMGDI